MRYKIFSILTLFSFLYCLTTNTSGQDARENATLQSYQQARSVLESSVKAYGGIEKIRSIENFTVLAAGETVQRNQSRRAEPPYDRTPTKIEVVIDLKGKRLRQIADGGFPGGRFHLGIISDGKAAANLNLLDKSFSLRPPLSTAEFLLRSRWLPQVVLRAAFESPSQLRYLGRSDFQRKTHEVISFVDADRTHISIFIDAQTNLLSKIEHLTSDAYAGDAALEIVFGEHKNMGGYLVPIKRIRRMAGETIEEREYKNFAVNRQLTDEEFKIPANLSTAPNSDLQSINKFTGNTVTVTVGGYNVLGVAFKDFIVVVEAPGGDAVSRQVIQQIKEIFPGKPIRYVVVTHHHDDHSAGVRTYVAEGATLLTTPDNRRYFESMVKSRFSISPDLLSQNPKPPKMEFVEKQGKRVFSDGEQTLEIYDIGAGPHAEEMLVAFLPGEKIIFQGDLLNNSPNGEPTVNETTVHFAKWLDDKKLNVERVIPVHGGAITINDMKKAVFNFKGAKATQPK